ncbi:hypothetical protein HN748_00530 [Candidatus Peregrinibacteria bacterium]|jgi:hypothetical protein|nr:hypothetical protein [Candidatus Peregrinibacteria bacterium]MBT7702697.1 hypothetical protein [Candidatus Peregrinibacteria bacterium]
MFALMTSAALMALLTAGWALADDGVSGSVDMDDNGMQVAADGVLEDTTIDLVDTGHAASLSTDIELSAADSSLDMGSFADRTISAMGSMDLTSQAMAQYIDATSQASDSDALTPMIEAEVTNRDCQLASSGNVQAQEVEGMGQGLVPSFSFALTC